MAFVQSDGFIELASQRASNVADSHVRGEFLDSALNLRDAQPGEVVSPPYELTIGAERHIWTSTFHSTNRLVTSRPFARRLGFKDQLLPFDMLLFLTGSMVHADKAVIQVSFKNARYLVPSYAGDTFKKRFVLQAARPCSALDATTQVVNFKCELWNQREELVFSVDKLMIFPRDETPYARDFDVSAHTDDREELLRSQIVRSADQLGRLGGVSLRQLLPGKLIVHAASRPLTVTQAMTLSTLGRVVHDRHFNARKFPLEPERERLYVEGALVVALVNSVAGRELHEILFQTLHDVSFTAPLYPDDVVSAVSYVRSRAESISGELEKLDIVTLGIKNTELTADLRLPQALFTRKHPPHTAHLREILKDTSSALQPENVVLVSHRSIYRQAPKSEPFLL